jgi:hypothetical protein
VVVDLSEQRPEQRDPGTLVPVVSIGTLVLSVLMMLCSPLTAMNLASPPMPPDIAAMDPADRPAPPPVRPVDAAALVIFFLISVIGTAGGVLGLLRLHWGRRLMILFGCLLLTYLALVIGFRLTGGLTDLVESVPAGAPKRSALGAFFVWTIVPIVLAILMLIASLKYLLRKDVAATFRGVKFT